MSEQHGDRNRLFVVPPNNRRLLVKMGVGSSDEQNEPSIESVLRSLDDDDCRAILRVLDGPKSVNTLLEECNLPRSTMYRKLELLREAELVREHTEIRRDGPNATLYERDFSDITIDIDDDDEFTIDINRPDRRPEDRLATFFTEMKKNND